MKWKMIGLLIVAAVVLISARYFHVQELLRQSLSWIRGLGFLGILIFIGIYIAACVFLLPGSVLTLGAGAIFGLIKGSIVVSVSATIGATCAFLVGRYIARGWVEKKIESHQKFKAVDEAVAREGWKIVGLTRLSPVFPAVLLTNRLVQKTIRATTENIIISFSFFLF